MPKTNQKTKKVPTSAKATADRPELRFPEFSGEWEEKKLREVLDYEQPTKYRVEDDNYDDSYGIPVLTAGKTFILGYTNEKEGILDASKEPVIIFDDFTTAKKFVDFPFKVKSSAMKILRNKRKDVSDIRFIFEAMQKIKFGLGNEHKRFWISEYSKIKIPIAILQEQQKIAEFLGVVDEWIENLREQKKKLEEYKKGLMQKIFSQEIRFKNENGKDFPNWKKKKLGEVLKERKEYSTKGRGFPHISLTTNGIVPKSIRYHRDFLVSDDKNKKYKITKLNDLCYNPANLKFGVISLNKYGKGIFSPIYVTFKITKQNPYFIGYYLTSSSVIKKMRRFEQGTVYERTSVKPSHLLKVEVDLPSLEEQQKIANFLTSVDSLIEQKEKQIPKAETWKKGLMQKMFV